MKIAKTLKKIMVDEEVKQVDIAEAMGVARQNFNNRLNTDNFRLSEIEEIANILGYDIKLQFVRRENGKIINAE